MCIYIYTHNYVIYLYINITVKIDGKPINVITKDQPLNKKVSRNSLDS